MAQNMGRNCRVVLATMFLVGTTLGFIVIGVTGPKSSQGTYHAMYMCIVPKGSNHIWNPDTPLIDATLCPKIGRILEREDEPQDKLQYYPIQNIVFYSVIPYLKGRVMSRAFEYLIVDMGVSFVFSSYIKEMMAKEENFMKFQVVLGYRDSVSGPWQRKVSGNVTRTLKCGQNRQVQELFSCDHLPLFELGSCHHKQYIINIVFPSLPLDQKDEYRGLSQLSRLSLYEIHQSPDFTRLWLFLKTIFLPLTLTIVVWFWYRLGVVSHTKTAGDKLTVSLVERFLGFLGSCLVFYNVPFQYLSLYYDCPWLLVLNDFQQGLFIAALFSFWIIFVGEHNPGKDVNSSVGCYWKQMSVVLVASIFLFVYEFCERGIQILYPFYSLWSNRSGVIIAWAFIGIASTSALLYLVIFLASLLRVLKELYKKQRELSSLTPAARQKYSSLFGSFWFFLLLTSIVAVCSVLTIVLPTEVLLHQWQHDKADYNIYSGLLTGNYGMWNAYCLVMMYLYVPSVSTTQPTKDGEDLSADPSLLQKFISKKSQE